MVGTDEMQRAQDRTGLSDERLARQIPVSERTWRRWKTRGAIPTAFLPRAAQILGLEIVRSVPVQVAVEQEPQQVLVDFREPLAVLIELVQRIAEMTERMEGTLGRIEQSMPAPELQPPRARGTTRP